MYVRATRSSCFNDHSDRGADCSSEIEICSNDQLSSCIKIINVDSEYVTGDLNTENRDNLWFKNC